MPYRSRLLGRSAPSDRARPAAVSHPALFLRRWLANPLQMGSIVPSSPSLCRRVVAAVRRDLNDSAVRRDLNDPAVRRDLNDSALRHDLNDSAVRRDPALPGGDEAVLELGAGTGVIGRALLAAGLPPERLIVAEIVPEMAAHLRRVLPGALVLEGDARRLPELVPPAWHGRIGSVICGIPLVLLPLAEQRRFLDAIAAVAPGRGFLLYSYCVTSPLPWRKHGLRARREAWTPLNFPPASVWRYLPAG